MNPCKACNLELDQNLKFCSQCGSKVVKDRLTMRRMFNDFIKIVTNLEGPFIKTTSSLFVAPQNVTVDFIAGKRKVINSPIRYGIIAVTIYGFFQFLFQDFVNQIGEQPGMLNALDGFMAGSQSGGYHTTESKLDYEAILRYEKIKMYLQKHQQFANFFIVPIFAFISSKIYEDSKYNYAEHFSIFLYAVSLSLLISSSIGILFGLFNSEYLENVYHYINYFLSFVVVTWIAYKSYEEGFSYAIGVYFLSYIFYFFSLMVLFFIFIN